MEKLQAAMARDVAREAEIVLEEKELLSCLDCLENWQTAKYKKEKNRTFYSRSDSAGGSANKESTSTGCSSIKEKILNTYVNGKKWRGSIHQALSNDVFK